MNAYPQCMSYLTKKAKQHKAELDERGKRYAERDPVELGKLRRFLQLGREVSRTVDAARLR